MDDRELVTVLLIAMQIFGIISMIILGIVIHKEEES